MTIPAAPSDLVGAHSHNAGWAHIAWTDNSDNETGFRLERSLDSATWTQIATPAANSTSYDDYGISRSTIYYYRIRATNSAGDSDYSNTAIVLIPDFP